MIQYGEIWWTNLGDPQGSAPGYRRPVLVVQSEVFNKSKINTVIVLSLTSNVRLALAPGNVLIPRKDSGLPRDSVANISQVLTLDKSFLAERVGVLPHRHLRAIREGLRLVLDL